MHLNFSIEYRTEWGQYVAVEVLTHRVSGKSAPVTFILETEDGLHWGKEVILGQKDVVGFRYEYVICHEGKVLRREWPAVPRYFTAQVDKKFIFRDYWKDIPILSHLYSSAYMHSMSCPQPERPQFIYFDKTLVFRVQAPQLQQGQALALVGSQPPLGAWMAERCIRMSRAGLHEWVVSISAEGLYLPFEYKYVIIDERSGELVAWEQGDNRHSPECGIESGRVIVVSDKQLHVQEKAWKTAGVVIPVFSLRSRQSQGVGDFGDLKRMADWAEKTHMHVIQLLPIYDTVQTKTWRDCYPYNSISIYAFHPMYVDLGQLPAIKDAAFMEEYETERQRLNALPQVDYEAVNNLKDRYLRLLYAQEGKEVLTGDAFQNFWHRNEEWLVPYSAFCMLRDKYGTCDFKLWPKYNTYVREEIYALSEKKRKDTGYYAYVQFILDRQLTETIAYSRAKGVLLKGDIPIGISRTSVEAWVEPYYFHMNGQAGAPPDAFSTKGQNWGFPTYNWDRMAEDGYRWWVRRFRKMAEYFDAYRIDHVLGFFRIWQIPLHSVHGLLGQFSPSLPMSVEEIESYGLKFRKEEWTQPYITDAILADVFGAEAEAVRAKYILPLGNGRYALRPEYATQRQVMLSLSESKGGSVDAVREGLYTLISNVLFVPDSQNPELYHPRIAVMDDFVFQSLEEGEKDAFRQLYEQYYYHRHNDFWYSEAMKKLPTLVQSTQMLVCAEDLGMVPACVAPCMEALKMLSLEIQAMPKAFGVMFGSLEENPYRSVSTIFTHDMPTLRGWWEEDYGRTQRYYNQMLHHEGVAPRQMTAELCEEVVSRHLYSPSMLCLLSLQDWLSIDADVRHPHPEEERINIPSIPDHYWRYRMHLCIESLLENEGLSHRIASMIARGGRG